MREGVISYGVSSYGYDIRVADEFRIFTNSIRTIVDPKHFDAALASSSTRRCLHRSAEFLCARPFGRIFSHSSQRPDDLPRQVHVRRCGIIVNVTPFDPNGKALSTLEISNTHASSSIYAKALILFLFRMKSAKSAQGQKRKVSKHNRASCSRGL